MEHEQIDRLLITIVKEFTQPENFQRILALCVEIRKPHKYWLWTGLYITFVEAPKKNEKGIRESVTLEFMFDFNKGPFFTMKCQK